MFFVSYVNSTVVMKMVVLGPFCWLLLLLTRWLLRNQFKLMLILLLLVLLPGLDGHPWRFNWKWFSHHMVLSISIDTSKKKCVCLKPTPTFMIMFNLRVFFKLLSVLMWQSRYYVSDVGAS